MPVYVTKDGFPLWGNPSPQDESLIPARQIRMALEDLTINQIPGGRMDEIPIRQQVKPRQPIAEGAASGNLQEVGRYGSTLYDDFMSYFDRSEPKVNTP